MQMAMQGRIVFHTAISQKEINIKMEIHPSHIFKNENNRKAVNYGKICLKKILFELKKILELPLRL